MSETATEETAAAKRFDPTKHFMNLKGKAYLPVAWRLVWFREEHAGWGIVTEAVEIDTERQFAIFRASIFNEDGRLMATGTKFENVQGFGDYVEKAETGAVGRALLMCGYGTAAAGSELDEGDRLADAPQPARGPAQGQSQQRPPYQPRQGGNTYTGGQGGRQ